MNRRTLATSLGLLAALTGLSAPALAGSVFDTPPERAVTELTPEVVKADPMAALFVANPPWADRDRVMALLRHNAALYHYLPPALRADPEVRSLAEQLGLPKGVRITADSTGRVAPRADATPAKGPSDTTNGYLVDGRPTRSFVANDRLPVLATQVVDGVTWIKVFEGKAVSREKDRSLYRMLSNVGGVPFDDFSLAADDAWIPAAVTEPAIHSARFITGLYPLGGVEHGDLGIYVTLGDRTFSGFDSVHETLLTLVDAGTVSVGDQIRVVWREPLRKSEAPELVWAAVSLP
ncbi:MAG: hypothetical protein VX127_00915 [Myxococcota bacterium]|nr:hypothetical protein [Myxococcota bacterium]